MSPAAGALPDGHLRARSFGLCQACYFARHVAAPAARKGRERQGVLFAGACFLLLAGYFARHVAFGKGRGRERQGVLLAGACAVLLTAAAPAARADVQVRTVKRDYLHSQLGIYGRVVDGLGRPEAGVTVTAVSSTLTGAGGVVVASSVTGPKGRYGLKVPNGPPRIITVTANSGEVLKIIRERVAPSVWVHAVSHPGGRIVFRGRLWGPGGTIVTLMDRTSTGEWATFAVHRASPAGLFVIRYRAPAALRGRSLRFLCRATTWPVAGWRSGVSRPGWAEVW